MQDQDHDKEYMTVEKMRKWVKITGYGLQPGHYNISTVMITYQWKEKK